jgi:hypothetical protein
LHKLTAEVLPGNKAMLAVFGEFGLRYPGRYFSVSRLTCPSAVASPRPCSIHDRISLEAINRRGKKGLIVPA